MDGPAATTELSVDSNYMKHIIFQSEMLTDAHRGIYTVWTYWSDGSMTKDKVTKGPIFIPQIINWFGF